VTILLDNTILSNFSILRRPDLVRQAFLEEVVTTKHVFREIQVGVTIGRIPPCDWDWLKTVALKSYINLIRSKEGEMDKRHKKKSSRYEN